MAAVHHDNVEELQIRPAFPGDFSSLERIFGAFIGRAYAEQSRQRGTILVATVGAATVAAMFVSTGPPAEAELIERLGNVPILHSLNVEPRYRRRGVGTQMIDAAERMLRAAGCSRLAVGVDLENDGAARLYRRLGYREWPYGLLKTFREHGDEAGNVLVTPDECRLFVKELPPDGRRLFA